MTQGVKSWENVSLEKGGNSSRTYRQLLSEDDLLKNIINESREILNKQG
jgi:hypothetical protein